MLLNDFYTIQSLEVDAQSINAIIHLNKDHAIFQGHFPDNPVVPGVCLMAITKEVLEQVLEMSLALKEAKSVKFLGVVNPNEQAVLKVQCDFSKDVDTFKTTCVITAGEKVCYKAGAIYTILVIAMSPR
ncbi:3-hydroxyacyl-ACP dehydratase [soil metagenome]